MACAASPPSFPPLVPCPPCSPPSTGYSRPSRFYKKAVPTDSAASFCASSPAARVPDDSVPVVFQSVPVVNNAAVDGDVAMPAVCLLNLFQVYYQYFLHYFYLIRFISYFHQMLPCSRPY